jgi:alkyldihydroxyacetonephosphate synthase
VTDPHRPPPRVPPIPIGVGSSEVVDRFSGPRVAVDEEFLGRLRRACDVVDVSPDALAAAGRDWWPISLHWALAGSTGARPAVVVRPRSVEEVVEVLRCCNERSVPVCAAGGRSGVTGGAIPVFGGVALDLLGLSGVTDVDDVSGLVTARAGTYGSELAVMLSSEHGLTLGHWPQSIDLSTVGGWLACRAAGQYSTRYGKIEEIVAGLEVVLADGRVIHTGGLAGAGPRSAMGPDLTQLFVGSEGTLGIITAAQLRAHPLPAAQRRQAWAFPSFSEGLDALRRTLRRGATPAVVRLHDATEAARSWDVSEGHLLMALDEGDEHVIDAAMAVLAEECASVTELDSAVVGRWLERRNDVSELTEVIRLGIVADTIEVAAPWSELSALYEDALKALAQVQGNLYGSAHASHSYLDGGCLYFTFAGQGAEGNDQKSLEAFYRRSWAAVMDSTRRHRGSISHHHGIGLVRSGYLKEALGQGFEVLVALKAALDPGGILNPGKLGLPTAYGPPLWEKMATGDSSAGESLGAGSSGSTGDTHPESSEGSQP